jgi:hypothetical protein
LQDPASAGWEERAIEWLIAGILDALALTLLLRRYRTTDRTELADVLGSALAGAAERELDHPSAADADWLTLFAESCAVSDDARLRSAGERLIARLREQWAAAEDVESAAWSVGACLMAADLVDPHELIPMAIDELERIVGAAYRPGRGIGHRLRVPVRLAALHGTPAYRDAAVLAPDADYDRDAGRVLASIGASMERSSRDHGVDAAAFGLALTEWAGRS